MTEFVVATLRIGFLVLMWLFILFVANIIRTDLIGQEVAADEVGLSRKARRQSRRHPEARDAGPRVAIVVAGTSSGLEAELDGVLTIGRSSDQSLTIDDDYASTRHALVRQDGAGNWVIEDLNSTNGTYVNGQQISEPTVVGVDDQIRIGRTHIKLEK